MSYIPPEWTQDRLAIANTDELSRLPYETLHLIPLTSVSPLAQDLIFGARIDERTRLERQRLRLPTIPLVYKPGIFPSDADPAVQAVAEQRARKWLEQERVRYFSNPSAPLVPETGASNGALKQRVERDPVVQVVEEAGYYDFGFMVVRLDYSDEDAWTRWCELFDVPIDRSVAESVGGERILERVLLPLVEDAQLEGTGWHGVVSYFQDLQLNSMVQPGLDTSLVLVADKAAVDSLLSPTPGQEPWVWAVDVNFGFQIGDQPPQGEQPTEYYPGYFRVALSAALSELWPLLMGPGLSGRELWRSDVRVWEGII